MVDQARPKWHRDGLCLESHPGVNWFATHRARQAEAVDVCRRCLVVEPCLAFALEHNELGVWGATTEAERRIMRRDQAA